MIGAAAASDHLQVGQQRQQFGVIVGELVDIANIDLRGCIKLGVTLCRGIGPQSANAADPWLSASKLACKVAGMGAVDHVVGRRAAGRLVDLGNGDAERLASW